MTSFYNNFIADVSQQVHPQWLPIVSEALTKVDTNYLQQLASTNNWLPQRSSLLAALSNPLDATQYVLLGESPYPRLQSANGYAFWDGAVDLLWSDSGFSKQVNRATSLRNFIKMLLHARGDLSSDFSQLAIASVDKTPLVKTAHQLFSRMLDKGFLLLNASLVYSAKKVNYHARQWRPFIESILLQLADYKPGVQLVLLGRIAKQLPACNLLTGLVAEHPYNLSFITNPTVLDFFNAMDLLADYD